MSENGKSVSDHLHWAQVDEVTFVAGIRFMLMVQRLFGRWPFLLGLYPVVLAYWLGVPHARRASMDFLRRASAFGAPKQRGPLWWQSLRHFLFFAKTMLDKFLAYSGRYDFSLVEVDRCAMLEQFKTGRGGVIVTAHMGCLEMTQALADDRHNFSLTILVHTQHTEEFNQLLQEFRPDCSVQLLQVSSIGPEVGIRLQEIIDQGGFIAIAGDRVPVDGMKMMETDFLGDTAGFPVGPYVLAGILKCPLFTMSCIHKEQGQKGYVMEFRKVLDQVDLTRSRRERNLQECVKMYSQWLERLIRQSPLDWSNFFPFWEQHRKQ